VSQIRGTYKIVFGKKSMTRKIEAKEILGNHPEDSLGAFLNSVDTFTISDVPHRALSESRSENVELIKLLREMVVRHHVSPEAMGMDKKRREAIKRLGFEREQTGMKRFPTNESTRKGNLAEIFLAEYIVNSTNLDLPIYKLRYNPNIDQSMKGDDVLAFDLDSDPMRIMVGETKFRAISSKAAVVDIISGLLRSQRTDIPVSLQFVADRLFEKGEIDLATKVFQCSIQFALENLDIDYVGLLMSDLRTSEKFHKHTDNSIHRLAVISFSLDSPISIIGPCYEGLEDEYVNP